MNKNSNLYLFLKIIFILAFLPFVAIWFIWNKTDWKKQNKWLATTGIVVVFLIGIFNSGDKDKKEQEELATLNNKVAQLEQQLEETKQNDQEVESQTEEVKEEKFKVVNVVDGDTIKLENGEVVRYIGIDTPETKHPSQSQECFGQEASKKNQELVEGKEVTLVKDVSERDRYDRLLRYVYIDDTFVNDYLVRNGYANVSTYPPDVKYQDQFKEAEEEARNNKRGLWAEDACKEEVKPVTTTTTTTAAPTTTKTTSTYTCNCKKTCAQMSSCAEAQYQLNTCGCSARDGDKDGIACDSDCQ